MTDISFQGRVAIVTGAGGGLGRAHALDLAARGAAVVVNDLGGAIDGSGGAQTMADVVVTEITAAGGRAVANYDSVATAEGGEAIVRAAIDAFGRVDIVVNNAGNIRNAPFAQQTPQSVAALLDVHVQGAFNVTRPAFEHMVEQNYGRIVFTSSAAGIFGSPEQSNYSAAKGAIVGLANTLALEGAPHGIRVNTIAPAALSRMAADMNPETLAGMPTTPAHGEPEMITAMVVYLASEQNPHTHEIFSIARGRYARIFAAVTPGWTVAADEPIATAEDVEAHIDQIRDQTGYAVPGSLVEEFSLIP